jgi:hypothetical protein
MAKPIKKKWVSLKRFLQRLKLVDPNTIGTGDGGLMSNGFLDRIKNKNQNDSTFVIKDTAVVKPLK